MAGLVQLVASIKDELRRTIWLVVPPTASPLLRYYILVYLVSGASDQIAEPVY